MKCEIKRLDHHGRGISYIDDKIVFVENALPGEVVEVCVVNETSKYYGAKVIDYIEKSEARVKSKCPYYDECGGCHLRHLSYDDTIAFKKNKLAEIFKKYAGLDPSIEVIKCKSKDFYRNKVEIQVKDGVYGFFKEKSHDIIEIDRCINAEEAINSILLSTNLLHITNGYLIIKANYNGEIILDVKSEDEVNIEVERLRNKCKLVGIIYNDEIIFGADHFIEIIDGFLFKETYNSFFQVNRHINRELFELIQNNIEEGSTVIDMCSGVGTLSIVASKKAKKVYAVEILENAVKDALVNAKMNKVVNVEFMLGDAFKSVLKIDDEIDTILIDPPRSGLNKEGRESLLKREAKNIIYISCDPVTLSRDLKVISSKYAVEKVYLLDMFPYTYHVETVCVLKLKYCEDMVLVIK